MPKFWDFKKSSEDSIDIRLYGSIGMMDFWSLDGFDENTFNADMASAGENSTINIYLNSDGGSVFAAMAIYQTIKRHKGKVNITVDGIAASAATIITSAPNARVFMPTGSMMMIHNPSKYAGIANAKQLRDFADELDKIGGSLNAVYREKTNLSEQELSQMLEKDFYMTAEEAVRLGFADELVTSKKIPCNLSEEKKEINGLILNCSKFANMPKNWYKENMSKNLNEGENKMGEENKNEDKVQGIALDSITADFIKEKCPNVFAAIYDSALKAGIEQERNRIKGIEELAIDGYSEITNQAKFQNAITPEAYAVAIMRAEKENRAKYLANRQADAASIPVDTIGNGANTGFELDNKKEADKEAEKTIIEAAMRGFSAK